MRSSSTFACALALAALFSCAGAAAQDNATAKARELAATLCSTCHGADGTSPVDLYPNLRQQKAIYLEKQLKDFRDGRRKDPVMNNMAAPLDDALIRALAEHFSRGARP
ncbi:c-type cytochrome [Pseudothauera nasutitermitis]|uniref:c-type cytochrome n=1 Tax=Pseudothauera nasutitermitis TaxID=2565930 RepID=UPI001E5F403D|nr:cytochrome c [Pseudothauera nasutitermitis]